MQDKKDIYVIEIHLTIKMGIKRYKDQILSKILQTCIGEGVSKTKVVYASGLNFKTIKPYLATLNRNGLVEIISGPHPVYRTTQKGEDALTHLRALEELILEDFAATSETELH